MSIKTILHGFTAVAVSTYMALTTADVFAQEQAKSPPKQPQAIQKSDAPNTPKAEAKKPALRLIDIGFEGCLYCKQMEPIIEELKKKTRNKEIVQTIDLDTIKEGSLYDTINKQVPDSFPKLILIDANDKIISFHNGFASKEKLYPWITSHANPTKHKTDPISSMNAFNPNDNKAVILNFYTPDRIENPRIQEQYKSLTHTEKKQVKIVNVSIPDVLSGKYNGHAIKTIYSDGIRDVEEGIIIPHIVAITDQARNVIGGQFGTPYNKTALKKLITKAIPGFYKDPKEEPSTPEIK